MFALPRGGAPGPEEFCTRPTCWPLERKTRAVPTLRLCCGESGQSPRGLHARTPTVGTSPEREEGRVHTPLHEHVSTGREVPVRYAVRSQEGVQDALVPPPSGLRK